MEELSSANHVKFFEPCPVCHHMTYYPFSEGWSCIQPECEFPRDKRAEQPMSKNQRRKANKRARLESQKTP